MRFYEWLQRNSENVFYLFIVLYVLLEVLLITQIPNKLDYYQLFLQTTPNLILVVITFAYVLLTRDLVKTNQALFNSQSEPVVIAYTTMNDIDRMQSIDLTIDNVGPGTAKNIHFTIDPEDILSMTGRLKENSLIQRGIPVLGPKHRVKVPISMSFLALNGGRHFTPDIPHFQIVINYENSIGGTIGPQRFDIDISMYRDLPS